MLKNNDNLLVMWRLFFVAIFFVLWLQACGQKSVGDRGVAVPILLEKELPSYTNTFDVSIVDSGQIIRLISNADSVRLSGKDPELAKQLFWDAARKSKKIDYPLGVARSFVKLIVLYAAVSAYDSAYACYHTGLYYARKLPPGSCYPELFHTVMSWNYYQRGAIDSALSLCYRAMKEMDGHPVAASGYRNAFFVYQTLGAIWANSGKLEVAVPYIAQAEHWSKKIGDSSLMLQSAEMKASLLFKRRYYDSAEQLYSAILASPHVAIDQKIMANHNLLITT